MFYADNIAILVQFEGAVMHPLILVALMLGFSGLLVSIQTELADLRLRGVLHGNPGRLRLERLDILLSDLGEFGLDTSGREACWTVPGSCLVHVFHRNGPSALLDILDQLA